MKIEIPGVADTLVSQSSMFQCSLEEAWDKYMHPIFTDSATFEEVKAYIDRQIELGESVQSLNPEEESKVEKKEITITYPAGHSYDFVYEKVPDIHCPECGKKEVWVEDGDGDYYCGPEFVCVACSTSFTMPTYGKSEDVAKQLK